MQANAVLVTQPAIDFTTFLGLAQKMLGYSPSKAADASPRQLTDTERFLSCLAAFRDANAPAGLRPHLFNHVAFSLLVVADERDLIDCLQLCSGLNFVVTETVARGIIAAVITGTLAQWRDAVASGCTAEAEPSVRHLFNRIYEVFRQARLNIWQNYTTKDAGQGTFLLLEDKRGRS